MRFSIFAVLLIFQTQAFANGSINFTNLSSCFNGMNWGNENPDPSIAAPAARFTNYEPAGNNGPVHYEPGLLTVARPNQRNPGKVDIHLIQQGESTGSLWWTRPAYYPTTLTVNPRNLPRNCRHTTVGNQRSRIVSVGSSCCGRNGGDCPANGMGLHAAVDLNSAGQPCISMETDHVRPASGGDESPASTRALPMDQATTITQEAVIERIQYIHQQWAAGRFRSLQGNVTNALAGSCQYIFPNEQSNSSVKAAALSALCAISPEHESCRLGDAGGGFNGDQGTQNVTE
ncbi:MAG: hypothetical protein HRT44_03370 [Bdellovibrionales bacterium]|nr:hypothetical protein [Bdellovibrionales bacterium]NQZ18287.1 hypothetical protein [Bdellovibrionales bacterium]